MAKQPVPPPSRMAERVIIEKGLTPKPQNIQRPPPPPPPPPKK